MLSSYLAALLNFCLCELRCALCEGKTFDDLLICVYMIGKLLLIIVRHLVFG